MKRKVIVAVGILLALLGLRLFMSADSSPPPDDVFQITQGIEEMRLAAERGDAGALAVWIAPRATIQRMQSVDAERWIRRALSNADRIQIALSQPSVRVDGNRAVANIARGSVTYKLFGHTQDNTIQDLQLRLRKNKVRKWVFFSEMRWQVVSAEAGEAPEFSVD